MTISNIMKHTAFIPLFLAALLLASAFHVHAEDPLLPSIKELQQRSSVIESAEELSDVEKAAIKERYQLAIDHLRSAKSFNKELKIYNKTLSNADKKRARIDNARKKHTPSILSKTLQNASPDILKQQLTKSDAKVTKLKTGLFQLKSNLKTERSVALQQLISDTQEALKNGSDTSDFDTLSQQAQIAASLAITAKQHMQQSRLAALQARLSSRPERLSLMEAEIELFTIQLADAESYQAVIQSLSNRTRAAGASALTEELITYAQSLQSAPEPLQKIAKENIGLAKTLKTLSEQHQRAETQLARMKTNVSSLNTKFESLNRLLELQQFESSALFGAALRQERDSTFDKIDTNTPRASAEQSLTSSNIALFHIEENRPPYEIPKKSALKPKLDTSSQDWGDTIEILLKQRRNLVSNLSNAHLLYVDELSALLSQLRSFSERSKTYSDLLANHLFWIPSAQPFGGETITAVGNTLAWLLSPDHWREVAETVGLNLSKHFIVLASGILLIVIVFTVRNPLKQQLANMAPLIGKVRSDNFMLTVRAFAITAVLALPPALILFSLADLTSSQTGFTNSLSTALFIGGLVFLFLEFMLQLARKNGIAEKHFHWSDSTLTLLHCNNRWFIAIFIPIVIIMVLLAVQVTPEIRDGLGRIALVVQCIAIAAIAFRMMQILRSKQVSIEDKRWHWYVRHIGFPALIAAPLILMALSLWGYHYTATELMRLFLQSMVVITIVILAYYTLERALSVYERRLALTRLLAKRAEFVAKNADRDAAGQAAQAIPEIIESHEIDRHTLTNQTKTVIRIFAYVGAVIALWYVWRDLLPVVRSLNEVILWQTLSSETGQATTIVTLWNLIVTVAVLSLGVIAFKNLPGALEVMLLSRLDLAPGSGYAITTVLKYAIIFSAVLAATNLLGADWSKLQWLIAAMGVGLGFGLQEIVANFVSGIVILFERPFRLGDTVTIGGNTGTVTRIRIRATTISDWDRKELIIPNKTFITQDFINWTLTDPITRLIVPVGVDYGTDTEMVVSLLEDVAKKSDRVFDDPAPAALFLAFGDNSLNFELRVFTHTVLDRIVVMHELHMAIDKAFKAAGVGISYPQRDVHLDTRSPLEVTIKSALGNPS